MHKKLWILPLLLSAVGAYGQANHDDAMVEGLAKRLTEYAQSIKFVGYMIERVDYRLTPGEDIQLAALHPTLSNTGVTEKVLSTSTIVVKRLDDKVAMKATRRMNGQTFIQRTAYDGKYQTTRVIESGPTGAKLSESAIRMHGWHQPPGFVEEFFLRPASLPNETYAALLTPIFSPKVISHNEELDGIPAAHYTSTNPGTSVVTHLWVNLESGFLPKRIETRSKDGNVQMRWETHSYQRVNDIWFPRAVTATEYHTPGNTSAPELWGKPKHLIRQFVKVISVHSGPNDPDIPIQ